MSPNFWGQDRHVAPREVDEPAAGVAPSRATVPASGASPPREHGEERRLARARAAHQPDEAAGLRAAVHLVERVDDLWPASVGLRDTGSLDERLGRGTRRLLGPHRRLRRRVRLARTTPCSSSTTSSATRRTLASWVAITNAVPSSASRRTIRRRSSPERLSSSAVGSSATTSSAPAMRTVATAARCCSPPESSAG